MAYMKSPDLHPELVKSLLESVASWDPRASVPLALTYMRVGDEEVLKGFDDMALGNPIADEMLRDRYLVRRRMWIILHHFPTEASERNSSAT